MKKRKMMTTRRRRNRRRRRRRIFKIAAESLASGGKSCKETQRRHPCFLDSHAALHENHLIPCDLFCASLKCTNSAYPSYLPTLFLHYSIFVDAEPH